MDDPYGPDALRGHDADVAAPADPLRAHETSGFAIASLVLGIIWMYWAGPPALIFGYIAKGQIDRAGGLAPRTPRRSPETSRDPLWSWTRVLTPTCSAYQRFSASGAQRERRTRRSR
jgi:hypothetical protein